MSIRSYPAQTSRGFLVLRPSMHQIHPAKSELRAPQCHGEPCLEHSPRLMKSKHVQAENSRQNQDQLLDEFKTVLAIRQLLGDSDEDRLSPLDEGRLSVKRKDRRRHESDDVSRVDSLVGELIQSLF